MESGVLCVITWMSGIMRMLQWFVVNSTCPQPVSVLYTGLLVGFTSNTHTILMVGAKTVPSFVFDSTSNPLVLLDEVHCNGDEEMLMDCSHSSIGNHFCSQFLRDESSYVAIQCAGVYLSWKHVGHCHCHYNFVCNSWLWGGRGEITRWDGSLQWSCGGLSEWDMGFSVH